MTNEFKVMLIDAVVSIILFFAGKYAGANMFEDVKFLIAVLQPIVLAWLAANAFVKVQTMKMLERMDEMDLVLLMERMTNK